MPVRFVVDRESLREAATLSQSAEPVCCAAISQAIFVLMMARRVRRSAAPLSAFSRIHGGCWARGVHTRRRVTCGLPGQGAGWSDETVSRARLMCVDDD